VQTACRSCYILHGSFQIFDLPLLLTGGQNAANTGGPNGAALTIIMYLYQNGFQFMKLGYAAAIGWVLVGIMLIISFVQLKVVGKD
jgi:ABC-type sugar transport system permease subunit